MAGLPDAFFAGCFGLRFEDGFETEKDETLCEQRVISRFLDAVRFSQKSVMPGVLAISTLWFSIFM